MVTFRLAKHRTHGHQIVEIILDGNVVGVIYPNRQTRDGIRIISAHAKVDESQLPQDFEGDIVVDPGSGSIQIPTVEITFRPESWSLIGGKVVKSARS